MSDLTCTICKDQLTPFLPRVNTGSNCLECNRYSYNASEPAFLYLLTNTALKRYKIGIGIAGIGNSRIEKLIQDGWILHGAWHHQDKKETYRWEKKIFKRVEAALDQSADRLDPQVRRDRHWLESIDASKCSLDQLEKIIIDAINSD